MQTIRIVRPRETEIYEVDEPQIQGPNDVKIKVAFAGICPDEMPFFRQDTDMLGWGPILYPGTGHEMAGTIVDVGDAAGQVGFQPGMRVSGYAWNQCGQCYYCLTGKESHCLNLHPVQSTMSEYIVWHSRQLIRIPDSVSIEEACLTDPIGHSLRGIDRSNVRLGNSVMIIGGTVPGLILLQLAKMCGATHLTVVEPVEANRNLAMQLGAELCIDPVCENVSSLAMDITDRLGYDIIFEASRNLSMLSTAATLLARQGVLAYSSIYGLNRQLPVNISELFIKEAVLVPFHMAPYMLPRIQDVMERLVLKPLISKVYSMEDATKAYEATESDQYPHILVRINGC
jgi:L-iditol 2-dehydrogenase